MSAAYLSDFATVKGSVVVYLGVDAVYSTHHLYVLLPDLNLTCSSVTNLTGFVLAGGVHHCTSFLFPG